MRIELTGIAQETSLSNPEASKYFMVFNEDLRIPVSEEAVGVLVYYLNNLKEEGSADTNIESTDREDLKTSEEYEYDEEDDGVPSI